MRININLKKVTPVMEAVSSGFCAVIGSRIVEQGGPLFAKGFLVVAGLCAAIYITFCHKERAV